MPILQNSRRALKSCFIYGGLAADGKHVAEDTFVA